jgi:predicted P-loop ATPase
MLRHDSAWQNVIAFNEFSLFIETDQAAPWELSKAGKPWEDYDTSMTLCWLQRHGVCINSSNTVREIVKTVAREHPYHPVKRYLASLTWDRKPRIDGWLSCYLGAEDSALNAVMGARWLIQACARITRPGCQADATLLLIGPQGFGKSSTLRTLATDEWFTDHLSDLGTKDSRIELHGRWIIEMSEFKPPLRTGTEKFSDCNSRQL